MTKDIHLINPGECVSARTLLEWSCVRLGEEAGLASSTIRHFERGRASLGAMRRSAIRKAFEAAGVQFTTNEAGDAVVRMRNPARHTSSDPFPAPVHFKMAQAALGWTLRDLSGAAGLNISTIANVYGGGSARRSTTDAIRTAYESAGVVFIPKSDGMGPGVRMRDP